MVIITRSTNTQEQSSQANDTEPQTLTELCQLLRKFSDKVDGLCLFKDFATVEFEKINGKGTSNQGGWLFRVQQFFVIDQVKEDQKFRFGEVYDDPLVELKNLKQTTDVQSYQDKFKMLMNKVDFSESQTVSMFMVGLTGEIRVPLRMFKHVTMKYVSNLAKTQKATLELTKAKPQYSSYSSSRIQQSNVAPRTTTYPPKPPLLALPSTLRLGYVNPCSGQLYALEVVANVVEGEEMVMDMSTEVLEKIKEEKELVDCPQTIEERPQISFNALSGVNSFKTIRIKGYMGKQLMHILMDTGSTHNFIAMAAARRMGCQLRRIVPLEVSIANGNQMVSEYMCKGFEWTIQGITYKADVMIIPLGSCDMVLEVQWLATIGDILWNFKKPTMEYKYKGKRVVLRGSQQALWHMNNNEGNLNADIQEVLNDFKHPPNQKDDVELMVKELIDFGVIKKSKSSFSSPIVMVKKKDGNWRMCVDYMKLNKYIVKDNFLIPITEELLDELNGAKVFSNMNLRCYHQIRMNEDDIYKTAFRTHGDHYEFLIMPFGLTNAPSSFQALMNTVFKPFLRKFVLVFFDGILIYNSNMEDHLKDLRRKGRLVVGNDESPKKQIMPYFHKGPLGGHSGVHVTAKKLVDVFFWKGLKKMLKKFHGQTVVEGVLPRCEDDGRLLGMKK
ncbi:reverse transcriptase [Tanacetum coccineum]